MSNYKAGDTVVCIDAMGLIPLTGSALNVEIVAGNHYVVHSVGGGHTALVGREPGLGWAHCEGCGFNTRHWHYAAWRFIKLDPLVTDDQTDTVIRNGLPQKTKELLGIT